MGAWLSCGLVAAATADIDVAILPASMVQEPGDTVTVELTVVAEGVETRSQFDALRELGVDRAQGIFISPPIPVEEANEIQLGLMMAGTRAEDLPEELKPRAFFNECSSQP